ncbi:hypothetical protein [Bosea sp. 117]|uniref:hypothetical protein n=1 Tax=Bosea sp. 117 TaxID=1125973 RepID=UPI000689201F|nr:hypothetical protein [Bosea sp. 117]
MSETPLRLARALLGTALALPLAACPGESEPERRERVAEPAPDGLSRKTWLAPTDRTDPAQWLASRAAGTDIAASAPEVAGWRALLADADSRFDETDRMIANRAVQLETMLAGIGTREDARQLLDDLLPLAAPGSRRGFSDLCHHYFNLRSQGASREAALAELHASAPGPTRQGPTP